MDLSAVLLEFVRKAPKSARVRHSRGVFPETQRALLREVPEADHVLPPEELIATNSSVADQEVLQPALLRRPYRGLRPAA